MLIQDYSAYKIWESDQRERELKLARQVDVTGIKALSPSLIQLIAMASKLTNHIR
jgi:hypothetical protein